MGATSRDATLDILKGIGILLVIFGHTYLGPLQDFVYAFHMPLFFIAAGCLLGLGKNIDLKKKAKSLLVPYLCFSLLLYLYWAFFEYRFRPLPENLSFGNWFPGADFRLVALLDIPIASGGAHDSFIYNVVMWFLPCLFLVYMLYVLVCEHISRWGGVLILSILFYIGNRYIKMVPWYLDMAMFSMIYFVVGKYLFSALKKTVTTPLRAIGIFGASAIIVWIAVFHLGRYSLNMNMFARDVPGPWLAYTIPFVGFIMIYSLSYLIGKCGVWAQKVFIWLGVNSLLVMCLHEPIKRIVIKMLSAAAGLETEALRNNLPYSLIAVLLIALICVPFIILINKHLPWMLGKTKRKGVAGTK